MKRRYIAPVMIASASVLVVGVTLAAQDKYTVQVPGGLGSPSSGATRTG
jgi:hypothetical protein